MIRIKIIDRRHTVDAATVVLDTAKDTQGRDSRFGAVQEGGVHRLEFLLARHTVVRFVSF